MREFKKGDNVISRSYGHGVVTGHNLGFYNVCVKFYNHDRNMSYNHKGAFDKWSVYPDLYHEDEYPDYLEQHPLTRPDLKLDDPVYVSLDNNVVVPAHFAEWPPNKGILVFEGGRTSHTESEFTYYNFYKLPGDK